MTVAAPRFVVIQSLSSEPAGTAESSPDVEKWTHWGLNPGPSACEADVIPLHHVPDSLLRLLGIRRISQLHLGHVPHGPRPLHRCSRARAPRFIWRRSPVPIPFSCLSLSVHRRGLHKNGHQCSLWGSNPRPMAHKTIALTTELREPMSLFLPRILPHAFALATTRASFRYIRLCLSGLCVCVCVTSYPSSFGWPHPGR